MRNSVGPIAMHLPPIRTSWQAGSRVNSPTVTTESTASGAERRSRAWIRATSSRGENGLVT